MLIQDTIFYRPDKIMHDICAYCVLRQVRDNTINVNNLWHHVIPCYSFANKLFRERKSRLLNDDNIINKNDYDIDTPCTGFLSKKDNQSPAGTHEVLLSNIVKIKSLPSVNCYNCKKVIVSEFIYECPICNFTLCSQCVDILENNVQLLSKIGTE